MKKTSILIILFFLIFPTISSAKVVYCYKTCFAMNKNHIATIKGLLYEASQRQEQKTKLLFSPHVAKTIVWLEKLQKDTKTHNLKNITKDDRAKLVIKAIEIIIDVTAYKTRHNPKKAIDRWTRKGYNLIAEYEEKIVCNKTIIKYKLELKKNG